MTTDRTSLFFDWPGESDIDFWREQGVESFVYVIQGHPLGPVKVGRATDVRVRVDSLQAGNHAPLRILLVFPGGTVLERQLHRRLRNCRVLGEWFAVQGDHGFLAWAERHRLQVIENFKATGEIQTELPKAEKRKPPRGLHPVCGYHKRKLNQRWRTRPDEPAPVVVRFVQPDPKMEPAKAQAIRAGWPRR